MPKPTVQPVTPSDTIPTFIDVLQNVTKSQIKVTKQPTLSDWCDKNLVLQQKRFKLDIESAIRNGFQDAVLDIKIASEYHSISTQIIDYFKDQFLKGGIRCKPIPSLQAGVYRLELDWKPEEV